MFCETPEFGRCCFCLPLRRGVLVFGYLNILFSIFMMAVYSHSIHRGVGIDMVYHGMVANVSEEICLAVYCLEIIFNAVLVYGAHKQSVKLIKAFYYYTITTFVSMILAEVISIIGYGYVFMIDMLVLFFIEVCFNLYLIFLVRSLLKKLEISGQTYENQLHQFINGEIKIDSNGVEPSTVAPHAPLETV